MAPSDVIRTPDDRFAGLPDWPFEPRWVEWQGLRLHVVDEGPRTGPVMLLLHGEPTWSYLYRHWIPRLVDAGYRCVAPDHPGFGRSDKPAADDWYVIERHVEALRHVISELDLRGLTLVCQDWGGPIGLRQVCDDPDRFERLVIMNTWLHHEGYEYSDGIRWWREMSQDPERLGGDMPTGRIVAGSLRREGHDVEAVTAAYDAPFTGPDSKGGARRFPWCLPFAQPAEGGAAWQQRCFEQLQGWQKPCHFLWGDADNVFTYGWAEQWSAQIPTATLDRIEGAGHFVQEDAAADCVDALLRRIDEE